MIITSPKRIGVLLPQMFRSALDYTVPEGMELQVGDYVSVPLGRREVWGVVWGEAQGSVEEKKLKSITRVAAHLPPMSEAMRSFIDWVAWYTLSPSGLILKMAIPVPEALEPPAQEMGFTLAAPEVLSTIRMTPARLRVVSYLSDAVPRTAKDIATHARVSTAVIHDFVAAGGLVAHAALATPRTPPSANHAVLDDAQAAAAQYVQQKITGEFSVSVLDGVTGSGKTEVYFDAIVTAMEQGKQALVLLPEIALSVQWLSRFKERFGFAPVVWHSHVTPVQKRNAFRTIIEGTAPVVVGARSALFLPLRKLGLIIVDEEHEASYKQEDGVLYHARDMAVMRALKEKVPVVLVSATPSLETEQNIAQGKYKRLHLPTRFAYAELPTTQLIDLRKQTMPSGSLISEPLRAAIARTVLQGNQVMLFMNRRGYAPLFLCRACGHRFQCPHCSAWLVLHRHRAQLLCHHCGHVAPVPKECPACHKEDTLIAYGPGVERVAEEVHALFPAARMEIMTSDHVDTPAKASALVERMEQKEIDILVGTQMIAKGYHFAHLALVGVIDADMGLAGGDLRAAERTYQLLHQLAGRAGRAQTRGEVLLQTYLPEHPVMQALAAGDRERFMQLEARMREEAGMPPFGKLAAVIIDGADEQEVARFARALLQKGAPLVPPDVLLLGPAPAPLSRLRGRFRYRLLIKTNRQFPLQSFLQQWLLTAPPPSAIKVRIDVEPYNFA